SLKLWEYFIVNVDSEVKCFSKKIREIKVYPSQTSLFHGGEIETLKRNGMYRKNGWERYSLTVDLEWAVKLFGPTRSAIVVDKNRLFDCTNEYRDTLHKINYLIYEQLNKNIRSMLNNIEH